MTKKVAARKPKAEKEKLLATGGGHATASGVDFQSSVAAYFASEGLAGATLDARLGLGAARMSGLRFETEAPVDDILISLDTDGWVFIQSKNSLTSSASLTSELGKTCDEFARLWEVASGGSGARGWDHPLTVGVDAMVIAVGTTASGTIKDHLARALDVARDGSVATLSGEQGKALTSFKTLLGEALHARGGAIEGTDIDQLLKFIHVLEFDFGGAHRTAATAVLATALTNPSQAAVSIAVLEKECERRMATRNGIGIRALRSVLAGSGVPMNAAPDYRSDVAALKARTSSAAKALQDFERTQVASESVTIRRTCSAECVAAARDESLVVVGDPGTGKSAVINETARQLAAQGSDVVLLDVDRLQVDSVEGLSTALGISHPLAEILANWPGLGTAYLVLDALDACRFGRSEALFRNIMQEVLELEEGRWRVIASIRTFDLLVGQEFGRLFRGVPPRTELTDQRFQMVRHIRVPEWSGAEFDEILTRIPALRVAIANGGPKLSELARVPFNTRLLAELLTAGTRPERLGHLGSQVQLLEMYWDARVRKLGSPAEQCLRTTVTAMINRGRMEVTRIAAGTGTGDALDQLLKQGVLNSVNGSHDVAFRHHMLFDYAASRTVVDLNEIAELRELLKRSGAGLLLAPALLFALQHLWETSGTGRDDFWKVVADLASASGGDPIARTVAARVGADLPAGADDVKGLLRMMARPSDRKEAFGAFAQVVGSLSVRLEDEARVPLAPWCELAGSAALHVGEIAWPLRTLIQNLIDRATDSGQRTQLGLAARAVMNHAFDVANGEMLMALAIEFVAKTFGSDPAASRRLVERLLDPARMQEHAANDMYWLANHVSDIAVHDPGLVVEMYDRIFTHRVDDDSVTSLGHSRILSLTSNRRQDYKMAQWNLKEAFSSFAGSHPNQAAEAAVRVARAYIENEHAPTEAVETETMTVGSQTGRITQDYSYIWAGVDRNLHSDDAAKIVDDFSAMLKSISDAEASSIADMLIADNEYGWLWDRLLGAAAERGGVLAAKLWPWAAQPALLRAVDTMERSIELLASQYASRTPAERREVEESVFTAKFPLSNKPEKAAAHFRQKVFCAIGQDELETQAAKDLVKEAVAAAKIVGAEVFKTLYHRGFYEHDEHGWLRDKGVDVEAQPDASILDAITACEDVASHGNADTDAKLAAVRTLSERLMDAAATAHTLVVARGWESIACTIERMTAQWSSVSMLTASQRAEIESTIDMLCQAIRGLSADDGGMLERARKDCAGTMMNIVRKSPATAARFAGSIRSFAADDAFGIRSEIAARLGYLWNADQALMWDLADGFVASETNAPVLAQLISFLVNASNAEPTRIWALAQTILQRGPFGDGKDWDATREGMGSLVFHLWLRHAQAAARRTIGQWLADRTTYKTELRRGALSMREGLVLGYDSQAPLDRETLIRCQHLAFEIVDLSARGVEEYFDLPVDQRTETENDKASNDAALLDQMSDQFFYAVGAPGLAAGGEPPFTGQGGFQKRYLDDNEKTFRRIGDAGTPSTIYHMLRLLDFLAPADPGAVFDLASHALLEAGRMHGYQLESLGATQFVTMIGRMIADHRGLFDDEYRRLALVEILQVFAEAGWPAARRLLYHLPEALR